MKNKAIKWTIIVSILMGMFIVNTGHAQGTVSFQVFYDELRPHGAWIQHSQYGNVWVPRVERGFVPYATRGHWIYTEYGNTWVSDYSWGWAPFHYGRWFYDDFYGWAWVPDTVWGPAWVAWRSGGGYYGWAPLMPGFGIHVSVNYYNRIPHSYWSFVPYRYITYRHVYSYCVPRTRVVNVIHNTTIINHRYTDTRNRTYFSGPTRSEIEKTGRTRVEVYKVNESSRPGRPEVERGRANFYRPEFDNPREDRSRVAQEGRSNNTRDLRRESASEFPGREMNNGRIERQDNQRFDGRPGRNESSQSFREMEKSQQSEKERQDRSFEQFKQNRQNIERGNSQFNERPVQSPQRQSGNRSESIQRQRDQFSPAPRTSESNQRGMTERQPQQIQRPAQQNENRMNRQDVQRQAPSNQGRTMSQPQREQINRSSPQFRNNQPSRSQGESKSRSPRGRE